MEETLLKNKSEEYSSATTLVNTYAKRFISQDDINAVGIGFRKVNGTQTEEVSIKAFVTKKLPANLVPVSKLLPSATTERGVKNIKIDVEEMDKPVAPHFDTGVFSRLDEKLARAAFPATISPGKSSSNIQEEVGTICICAKPKGTADTKFRFFLSCNHVFASFNFAPLGIPITEPSKVDGGILPYDFIGRLYSFVPLIYGPFYANFMDVGVAYTNLYSGVNIIGGIGKITTVGDNNDLINFPAVKKVGRTSGITYGNVAAVHATIKVDYWYGRNTLFGNQIITSLMGAYGDSGSVLLDQNNHAQGMLFSGSATHTFFSPLDAILQTLGLEI